MVVGGEAKRWARDRERPGTRRSRPTSTGAVPDVDPPPGGPAAGAGGGGPPPVGPGPAVRHDRQRPAGRRGPVARRHRAEIAELWARFNGGGPTNPAAAFPGPLDADQIATPSPQPAAGLPVQQVALHPVDRQPGGGAGVLLGRGGGAARGADRPLGLPPGRPGVEPCRVSCWPRAHPTWPAMEVLGDTAAAGSGGHWLRLEVIEVYSCFPAAVRVQQRALGLDLQRTPTVTGGMAFAGGPFNNFVLQSMVAVAAALRAEPHSLGLVTTVSGLLTKPGIGVWSARPDGRPPLLADLAFEVESVTGVVDAVATLDGYDGEATVATYTVTYEGLDPVRVVAVCDTDDGRRCVAISEDRTLAAAACTEEFIGTRVQIGSGEFAPL